MKCYGHISYWDLFCGYFYILSVYPGLAGNPVLATYMISFTRFLVLWRNLLLWYQIALGVAVCTTQPHAPFTWNETKSFACRLCNWQKKFQLPSASIRVTVLSDKGKIYFLFQVSRNKESMCVKHSKCKRWGCCQFKSPSSERSGLFKKVLQNELNRNLRFSPGTSASVRSSQHWSYAVSIPNTLKAI